MTTINSTLLKEFLSCVIVPPEKSSAAEAGDRSVVDVFWGHVATHGASCHVPGGVHLPFPLTTAAALSLHALHVITGEHDGSRMLYSLRHGASAAAGQVGPC